MEYNITYRQKDKGWQFIVSYKIEGKWKQKSKQGFKTKKDAKPAAEKMVLELKKAYSSKKSILNSNFNTITFEELKIKFLEHEKIYKEPGSIRTYTVGLNRFKELNEKVIDEIKKADIQSVIDALVITGVKANTLESYLQGLNKALRYYQDNYNPNYVLPTKKIILPKKTDPSKKALTKNELDSLLEVFKNKTHMPYQYIICLLAGTCGLRYGEIMGLTWSDIDEANLKLSVNKQWKLNKEGKWDFGILKSKKSKRIIPIPAATLLELKRYKKENPTDKNNRIIIKDFEVCRITLNINLRQIADISIHELRHTYATLLIANGIDFKTAAEFLGHDVRETIRTYSHVTSDMIENARNKIDNIFL